MSSRWESQRALGVAPIRPKGLRTCEHCKRTMYALLYTLSCDNCDAPLRGLFYRGYVLCHKKYEPRGGGHYCVWPSVKHAKANQVEGDMTDVRLVLTREPIFWVSLGAFATVTSTPQLDKVAGSLYQVYPDHRYEAKPHTAFLAPDSVPFEGEEMIYLT
jgi:hypothetical protein